MMPAREEGHLFVAMKGTQVDGHKFIPKALELGAKSVLCEDMPLLQANLIKGGDLDNAIVIYLSYYG